MIQKTGSIYYAKKRLPWSFRRSPDFEKRILINFSFYPNPELKWGEGLLAERQREKNKKLFKLSLITKDLLSNLKGFDGFVEVAVEISDIDKARKIFGQLTEWGITDIYLYQNSKLIDKYD